MSLAPLAAKPPSVETLLELLASPNVRSRRQVWRRYDHMNGTNTLVGPGAGDAALLRIKGTPRALAVSLDGPSPSRIGMLDPRLAAISAVIEAATNVACSGARPIGITNCLNLGSPESPAGYWRLAEVVAGLGEACDALDIPVVSGNVSLYNETVDGPILPTPVVGMIGLLEDRSRAVGMAWADGDDVWLLGDEAADSDALAGSELAWRRGATGGRPRLDPDAAARAVRLLGDLAADGMLHGAHDASVGGVAAGLARMAIAAGCGADVTVGGATAGWFGERAGRVLLAVAPARRGELVVRCSAAGVSLRLLGSAGGRELGIDGLSAPVDDLRAAWETPF
jgi:phosphoribosylformylglycinamidine synthase